MIQRQKQAHMNKAAHHDHLLYFGDALPKNGPQLVPDASQQESKQRNPQQSVNDTEDPPTFCVRRDVPKS